MTTTVKVYAHCADDKEVKIEYTDELGSHEEIIQDGDERQFVVYDDKSCTVTEQDK